jgi:hypothetical protein
LAEPVKPDIRKPQVHSGIGRGAMGAQQFGNMLITGGFVGLVVAFLMMLLALGVVLLDRRHWAEVPDAEIEDLIHTD